MIETREKYFSAPRSVFSNKDAEIIGNIFDFESLLLYEARIH